MTGRRASCPGVGSTEGWGAMCHVAGGCWPSRRAGRGPFTSPCTCCSVGLSRRGLCPLPAPAAVRALGPSEHQAITAAIPGTPRSPPQCHSVISLVSSETVFTGEGTEHWFYGAAHKLASLREDRQLRWYNPAHSREGKPVDGTHVAEGKILATGTWVSRGGESVRPGWAQPSSRGLCAWSQGVPGILWPSLLSTGDPAHGCQLFAPLPPCGELAVAWTEVKCYP